MAGAFSTPTIVHFCAVLLIAAQLHVGLDYRVEPPDALGPPITFTFMTDLPADVLFFPKPLNLDQLLHANQELAQGA